MTAPTAEKLRVNVYLAHGDTDGAQRVLQNFAESTSTTGNLATVVSKEYAASATNQTVDLSTFCDTATWICIKERAGVGIHVALDSSATAKFRIAANGLLLWKNSNSTPPTLYLTNPDGSNATFIEIMILGSAS